MIEDTSKSLPTKLNLGCGFSKMEGYLNVDISPDCEPDEVWDLENTPWPWPENSFEAVLLDHVLEHLGETPRKFIAIMQELYRVCKPDAVIHINVPHARHKVFLVDPTHIRAIYPETIAMFDQTRNCADLINNGHETKLGLMYDVDFRVSEVRMIPDPTMKQVPKEQWDDMLYRLNNVCIEIGIEAIVVKPQIKDSINIKDLLTLAKHNRDTNEVKVVEVEEGSSETAESSSMEDAAENAIADGTQTL